ncbi:MAG: macro domain-containing protein [Candidatus Coproplasma sp.]
MGQFIIKVGNIVDDELLKTADAIVCPTNPMMKLGSGACGAIFRKAGVKELEDYTEKTFGLSYDNRENPNAMKPTEIRITPGFNIPCDIIFAQGVKVWNCNSYAEALILFIQTYKNLLDCITQKGYKTVLIPALGTGHYGFTHKSTAQIVKDLLTKYAIKHDLNLVFVVTEEGVGELYR